jgi:D-alanine-D-alanine ligase
MLTGKNIFKALIGAGYEQSKIFDIGPKTLKELVDFKPNFAFNAMFCKWGEDGTIQGFLEVMGIPYSGSVVEASSICKNKFNFYSMAKSVGIRAPEVYFYGCKDDWDKSLMKIKYPAIVKPSYQGYSLGVSLVENKDDLNSAIEKAFVFSRKITIEEYIDGIEYTVGVLEKAKEDYEVLPIIEIHFKKAKIQDTEAKDDPSLMEEILDAKIDPIIRNSLEKAAVKLFKLIGCNGVSRFDMRLTKEGEVVVLENNTCPGLLNYEQSDLPKQLKAKGYSMEDFVEIMIKRGLEREENKLEVHYEEDEN